MKILLLALLFSTPAFSQKLTSAYDRFDEHRGAACGKERVRLCPKAAANIKAITACMYTNRAKINKACKPEMDKWFARRKKNGKL